MLGGAEQEARLPPPVQAPGVLRVQPHRPAHGPGLPGLVRARRGVRSGSGATPAPGGGGVSVERGGTPRRGAAPRADLKRWPWRRCAAAPMGDAAMAAGIMPAPGRRLRYSADERAGAAAPGESASASCGGGRRHSCSAPPSTTARSSTPPSTSSATSTRSHRRGSTRLGCSPSTAELESSNVGLGYANPLAPRPERYLAPWARAGAEHGLGPDGLPKFDLDTWDERYFARLRGLLSAADARGVVVELVFFCSQYNEECWLHSPLHPAGNVNGVGRGVRTWRDFLTLRRRRRRRAPAAPGTQARHRDQRLRQPVLRDLQRAGLRGRVRAETRPGARLAAGAGGHGARDRAGAAQTPPGRGQPQPAAARPRPRLAGRDGDRRPRRRVLPARPGDRLRQRALHQPPCPAGRPLPRLRRRGPSAPPAVVPLRAADGVHHPAVGRETDRLQRGLLRIHRRSAPQARAGPPGSLGVPAGRLRRSTITSTAPSRPTIRSAAPPVPRPAGCLGSGSTAGRCGGSWDTCSPWRQRWTWPRCAPTRSPWRTRRLARARSRRTPTRRGAQRCSSTSPTSVRSTPATGRTPSAGGSSSVPPVRPADVSSAVRGAVARPADRCVGGGGPGRGGRGRHPRRARAPLPRGHAALPGVVRRPSRPVRRGRGPAPRPPPGSGGTIRGPR